MLRSIPYPYLAASLLLLQILLVGVVLGAGQRRLTLLSGLLSAPFALASVFFVPEYWVPVRVAGHLTGPEDFIFSFATGGTAWLLAIWPWRQRVTADLHPGLFLGRYVSCATIGVALSMFCWVVGMGAMGSALVGITAVWGALMWRRRDLWPISAAGAFSFATFYALFVLVVFVLWPHLSLHWNVANLWGPRLLNVPVEEIVWALAYGAVWPLFMAHVFGARLDPQDSRIREVTHGWARIRD
jgi:hypothetical protein